MIIGIGIDTIDIKRIEAALARHGQRFLDRVFTPIEQAKAARRAKGELGPGPTLAKRFAAKEACAKALGTGMMQGVAWRDMGVVNLPSGQPTMQLTGGAAKRLAALTPPGHRAVIHLAITDDIPHAQAHVVIEALADAD